MARDRRRVQFAAKEEDEEDGLARRDDAATADRSGCVEAETAFMLTEPVVCQALVLVLMYKIFDDKISVCRTRKPPQVADSKAAKCHWVVSWSYLQLND